MALTIAIQHGCPLSEAFLKAPPRPQAVPGERIRALGSLRIRALDSHKTQMQP